MVRSVRSVPLWFCGSAYVAHLTLIFISVLRLGGSSSGVNLFQDDTNTGHWSLVIGYSPMGISK